MRGSYLVPGTAKRQSNRTKSRRAVRPLPASALSEDLDNPMQALTAVFPVRLQAAFNAVRIPGRNSGNNLLVLGDRKVQVVNDGTGIETPVSFDLRLDGVMQGQKPRAGRGFDDRAMKASVYIEDSARARGLGIDNIAQLAVKVLQAGRDFVAASLRLQGRSPASQAFDVSDDGIEFAGVFLGEGRNHHARLAHVSVFDHVTFAQQPVQGTSDWSAAHGEVLRQIGFDDP